MNVLVPLIWFPLLGAGEETSLAFWQTFSFLLLISAVILFASFAFPSLDGWCLRALCRFVIAGV